MWLDLQGTGKGADGGKLTRQAAGGETAGAGETRNDSCTLACIFIRYGGSVEAFLRVSSIIRGEDDNESSYYEWVINSVVYLSHPGAARQSCTSLSGSPQRAVEGAMASRKPPLPP